MKTPILSSLLFYLYCVNLLLFEQVNAVAYSPIWLTNSYVIADSKKVINGDLCSCTTGNSSTPTATMTFTTAFSTAPNLGYGVSSYQGSYFNI